jgi:hypothetical protein
LAAFYYTPYSTLIFVVFLKNKKQGAIQKLTDAYLWMLDKCHPEISGLSGVCKTKKRKVMRLPMLVTAAPAVICFTRFAMTYRP